MRIFLWILLTTTPAWADAIDPELEPCVNASEGDECELENGTMGTCQPGECCVLD